MFADTATISAILHESSATTTNIFRFAVEGNSLMLGHVCVPKQWAYLYVYTSFLSFFLRSGSLLEQHFNRRERKGETKGVERQKALTR